MNISRRRQRAWGAVLFLLSVLASGQKVTGIGDSIKPQTPPTSPAATHPITLSEILAWKTLRSVVVSNDGRWMAYSLVPNLGDSEVVVRSIQSDKEWRFPVGKSAGGDREFVFSADSQWLAIVVHASHREAATLKKQHNPANSGLQLLNLASGETKRWNDIKAFAFSGAQPSWLAIHREQSEALAKDPTKDKPIGSDLLLRDLVLGTEMNVGNVSSFAFDKTGAWLAMTIDAHEMNGNGLELRNLQTGTTTAIDNGHAVYERLTWTESGDGLAVLKGWPMKGLENKLYAVVGVTGFASGSLQKVIFDPTSAADGSFPADMAISPNRDPKWMDGLNAILFGICDNVKKQSPDAGGHAAGDDEKPNLMVWNWQDTRLPTEQQVQERRDRQFSYLAIYWPREHRFVRLADESVRDVLPPPPEGNWAVGLDDHAYALMGDVVGRRYHDFYAVDLASGARHLMAKKASQYCCQSPDGSHILYYDDGNYHVCDLATAECRNVTAYVPTSFVDATDDRPIVKPWVRGATLGWTSDSKAILVSDRYDLWQVAADGSGGLNLTGNGKKDSILYGRVLTFDQEPDPMAPHGIDMSRPFYISMVEEWTKKAGVARIDPGTTGAHRLLWDDAKFAEVVKAKNADVFVYSRESHVAPPDLYVAGRDFVGARRLTDLSAQQRSIAWSSGAMLLDFTSAKGDKLQAALYLPANYDKGKAYPTIVHIYERLTKSLNEYHEPHANGFDETLYTSHGYAVLEPDIKYRINDPGMSAVWCVLPALKAAIGTGIVDARHVGLEGYSWGGYQTAFLVTQTNVFAAAAPGAPLTDMISDWGVIYKNTGGSKSALTESNQGRFAGPPLENLDAYIRNSPVFHAANVSTPLLMIANDQDGAVDFTQGMQYFQTLRRIGKPVVLLEYPGENHVLAKRPNQADYTIRMQAFFDHFLKGAPAPEWWSKGVSRIRLQAEIENGSAAAAAAGSDPDSIIRVVH